MILALSLGNSSAQSEYTELNLETTTYQWGAEVSWELHRAEDGNNQLAAPSSRDSAGTWVRLMAHTSWPAAPPWACKYSRPSCKRTDQIPFFQKKPGHHEVRVFQFYSTL